MFVIPLISIVLIIGAGVFGFAIGILVGAGVLDVIDFLKNIKK